MRCCWSIESVHAVKAADLPVVLERFLDGQQLFGG
jgi:hypothetical protein